MLELPANDAGADLFNLIEQKAESHEKIRITTKRNNAILLSEPDWSAIQKTLFLLAVPGMRESIREGMDIHSDECPAELAW